MPGARPRIKPLSASVSSGSSFDEVSQLELHLQRQLEEDIARIFDESIYSDLEVVCGKLKILTHSCILKARTHKFYHKLEAILHVNIGRNTFDEIYSFVSDAYTECDIQHQENEIICYLNEKLNLKPVSGERKNKPEDESDAYATPNGVSPDDSLQKTLSSSPSTELTKEYYALVPIEGQVLDRELVEQDELSSGFNSFIHDRTELLNDNQITHCIKPTTLSLNSSHISKINKHSIICEISKDFKDIDSKSFLFENDTKKIDSATSQVRKHIKNTQIALKRANSCETSGGACYSPDSLVADEPSSSSDYLSAAHSASPGGLHATTLSNLPDHISKMNNTFTTVSDSGFDNNGMLESLNSHKDVTLADVSLTESTFHDLLNDEAMAGNESASQLPKLKSSISHISHTSAFKLPTAEMSVRSSKDEKQRQNEEIVILESSSLSSETGSWESVFPPKMPEKDLCEKFINIERQNSIEPALANRTKETTNTQYYDSGHMSCNKSTSCFIDAASLIDEEDERQPEQALHFGNVLRFSSRPVPCESKQIISPIDYSEGNDNDDSLEQPDPDSIQKDISPTIFELTIASEDSIAGDDSYENLKVKQVINEYSMVEQNSHENAEVSKEGVGSEVNICNRLPVVRTLFFHSTPNNSIMSLKANDTLNSEESDNDASYVQSSSNAFDLLDRHAKISTRCDIPQPHAIRRDILFEESRQIDESSPNVSVRNFNNNISPQHVSHHTDLPRETEYEPRVLQIQTSSPKVNCYPATWIVDMSKMPTTPTAASNKNNKKPGDKTCDILKASSKSSSNSEGCKSTGSVDSDSSEKSTHKFYIDFSTLPDALASDENTESKESVEKKNIFSMFIDLGENSSVKEMPARLSSSLNTKKNSKMEIKHSTPKTIKTVNKSQNSTFSGDDTFIKLETLCNSSDMSISEILQNPLVKKIDKQEREPEIRDSTRTFVRDGIAPTIKEEPDTDQFCDSFVRLSDLDRAPAQKNDTVSVAPTTDCFERMTRSIPGNTWGDSCHTSSRSIDIISSFHSENALSLNRLFPHLKNDISRSMPGSLSGRTKSPLRLGVSSSSDRDELASDISEMSSVQSSVCRSIIENSTTEDTCHTSSLLVNCQSRLGQDLLRMFIEEIAPDVIVEVSGRRIKAHKCILSSRCQYFAGILSGGWVESAGNVISLPPFSYGVVHFALCHIYSGISTIPDSISIVELATIADMLSLEGLKEAIMFTLKAKYCHHFHEPCQVCTAGVLECFPLSSVYGLDELYRRCLRWITRHFRKVWPTKAFATLPSELLDKCYQEQMLNLTAHTLIDTVHDCALTVASLQRCRWAEVVARLCRRLAAAATALAASRLSEVVRAAAAARAPVHAAAARALDACLAAAVDGASPDELRRALALLQEAGEALDTAALRRRCEGRLLRAAAATAPTDSRRRYRHHADGGPTASAALPARHVPHAPHPPRGTDPPRVRTTKAQEERAKFNMSKSPVAKPAVKTPRARTVYENAKPRYLEPRAAGKEVPTETPPPARKPLGRLLSSSESSRNSSPVLPRAPPVTAAAPRLRPRTADPSTESLSDSLNADKYATYTKPRCKESPRPPLKQPSKCNTNSSLNNKTRATKIPVYLKQSVPRKRSSPAVPAPVMSTSLGGGVDRASPMSQPRHRGSLMMATKSSSAKMVPKIQKESSQSHSKSVKQESAKAGGKPCARSPNISDIPLMERSGTFLKDEPTFGDKTTNIDIDD